MAKQKNQATPDASFENIEQNLGKAEQFIEKNSRVITYSFIGLILVILLVMGYNRYILKPNKTDSFNEMFRAENYFKQDSLAQALNGDDTYMGFLDIIDEFGNTPSGNLAHYYAGVCYMRMAKADTTGNSQENFESAIKHLKKFDGGDFIVTPFSYGLQGDAYMELGESEKAVKLYVKAAHLNGNDFSAPYFLQRAGMAYSILEQHEKAIEMYKEILSNHHQSFEASNIKKFIALEEAKLSK